MRPTRRRFLGQAAALAAGFGLGPRFLGGSLAAAAEAGSPALDRDWRDVVDLPRGFDYQLISVKGARMDDGLRVPGLHDGMGAFPGPGGRTILVRNHEVDPGQVSDGAFGANRELLSLADPALLYDKGYGRRPALGGCTTLVYDTKNQRLERHFLSLGGTTHNCAGGITPWGSWITCEEADQRANADCEQDHGYNFEVPATAEMKLHAAVPLKAMGRFRHEAIAVDSKTGIVYQTEDRKEGLIYRFLPTEPGRLVRGGVLQALKVKGHPSLDTRNWTRAELPVGTRLEVEWVTMQEVESPKDDLRFRGWSESGAARFARAEGITRDGGSIVFASTDGGTKRCGQLWRYTPSAEEGKPGEGTKPGILELFIEPNDPRSFENGDNLTVSPWGDLVSCEDGPAMNHILGITPGGAVYKIARLRRHEFSGPAFSPDGSTLFVNVQKAGRTLAITGPWTHLRSVRPVS